jgi:hypothetical protein
MRWRTMAQFDGCRARLLVSLLAMTLTCCESNSDPGMHDASAPDAGALPDYGELGEVTLHETGLWGEVQIEGEWIEFHRTLRDLAETSDIAAEVRLVSAEPGRVIQGDAEEDIYCEINLNVETLDVFHTTSDETSFQVSLVLPRAWSVDAQMQSVENANASLPVENVVVFLRRRDDLDLYRVVNGWGIWAETSRDPLDAPLNPERIGDGGYYASDLKDVGTIPELVARVRELLAEPQTTD